MSSSVSGVRVRLGPAPLRQATVPGSRPLLASGLLALVTAVWFGVAFSGDEPVGWLWISSPVGAAILAATYWRTSRSTRLSQVTRRFWRSLAVAGALVGVATTMQAYDALRHPEDDGPHTGQAMLAVDTVALAIIMVALYQLPLGRRTATERVRVTLDASTIMAAAAVFIWHFQARHAVGSADDTAVISSAIIVVLALLAVFAVAKVALSSHAHIDKAALRLLALAMLSGSLTAPFAGYIEQHSALFLNQVNIPVVFFIATCAAVCQQRTDTADPAARAGRARSFSVLPYAAVAAVDTLLMTTIWSGDADARVVGGAAVLVTALVVLRQIIAFRDNHRLLNELDHSATHDTLTQLPNRALFHQRLVRALAGASDSEVSVVLIDLNDFKMVNDTLGHAAGDLLLVTVADRLRDCVGATGTVARLGGDEFAIVVHGSATTTAERITRDILAAFTEPVAVDGQQLTVRASFGIAQAAPGDDAGDLLRRADIAMYESKARGHGGWTHYAPGMQARGTELERTTAELRAGLDRGEFRVHYQPVVTLEHGELVAVEALVRWQHPERGLLGPADIIPVAEASGLIVDIGLFVLRQACRQLAAWLTERPGTAPQSVSVNVSAHQLRDSRFPDHVRAALADHHLAARRLTLEITETAAVGGGATAANLDALHALGVRLSLDDFGTGQSSFTLLTTCPVDQIKLDRSFVGAPGGTVIAAAVLQLARGYGIEAVAEGVETAAQAEHLADLGYTHAQGYHFAAPMPAEALGARVRLDESMTRADAV